jgi:hypothetical protein
VNYRRAYQYFPNRQADNKPLRGLGCECCNGSPDKKLINIRAEISPGRLHTIVYARGTSKTVAAGLEDRQLDENLESRLHTIVCQKAHKSNHCLDKRDHIRACRVCCLWECQEKSLTSIRRFGLRSKPKGVKGLAKTSQRRPGLGCLSISSVPGWLVSGNTKNMRVKPIRPKTPSPSCRTRHEAYCAVKPQNKSRRALGQRHEVALPPTNGAKAGPNSVACRGNEYYWEHRSSHAHPEEYSHGCTSLLDLVDITDDTRTQRHTRSGSCGLPESPKH